MRRTLFVVIFLALAAAPRLAAQTGEIGVSLTIVEPISLAARPDATVRHRAGEYVEISMPLELGGNGSQIVAVTGSAPVETGAGTVSALRVRNGSGSFEALTADRPVALGTGGKMRRSAPAAAVYRLDLEGKQAPGDVRLAVRYVIAPDA